MIAETKRAGHHASHRRAVLGAVKASSLRQLAGPALDLGRKVGAARCKHSLNRQAEQLHDSGVQVVF